MKQETTNKILAMFDVDKVKKMIADCPKDEIVILCPHWSINKPKYDESEDPEAEDWDFQEFEDEIGQMLSVNDYDDLIADPNGIMSE